MNKLQPVAWINRDKKEGWLNWDKNTNMPINIPLYTHSVKELTDAEILEVWRENERVYPMDRSRLLDRTKACIRKAQEKC